MQTYTAEVWVHGCDEQAVEYDIFNISGYQVSMHMLDWMREYDRDVEWLEGLPTETVLRVQFSATWEDCTWTEHEYYTVGDQYYDLQLVSWLEIALTDAEETYIDEAAERIVASLPF